MTDDLDAQYIAEMISARSDLRIGGLYRFRALDEDMIAAGKVLEAWPGDNGTTVYRVQMSVRNRDDEGRGRAFELVEG